MVTGRVSRRRFLEGTLASAGLGMMAQQRHSVATNRPKGANDRLSVGMVGTGDRGTGLMQWIHQLSASDNVEITAVCDIWRQRREAAAELVLLWNQREPRKCRTMAEICELKDVDVLFIATPDFQHALHARQAVEAGKDVYTEKPFGCDFQQIKMARDAVKKSGCIFQLGTQRRRDGISKAGQ